jgi:hypothetical protein
MATYKDQIFKEGVQAGIEREIARIKAVEANTLPGHEKLIKDMIMDGKTTGAEAATAIIEAERKLKNTLLNQHQSDAPDPVMPASTDNEDVDTTTMSLEDKLKHQWEKDATVRAEYDNDFDVYVAAERAIAEGLVKISGRKGE